MDAILPPPIPFSGTQGLKLSELISALSHALDITEGQPEGHCVRCCWIGMHIGRRIGLSDSASRAASACGNLESRSSIKISTQI